MKKDKTLIPKGMYCHGPGKSNKDGTISFPKMCPYWSSNPSKPEQENGYCAFLEKGDWDINKEANQKPQKVIHCDPVNGDKEVTYAPGELPFPFNKFGLLWDQCKECNINMGDENE